MRSIGTASGGGGPDAVLLRLPVRGGLAQAHRVGSDSVLWQARDRTPAMDAILSFDEFLGIVTAQDAEGRVVAVDLRLGSMELLSEERVRGQVVGEGAAVFGLDAQRRVVRITPVGTWNWPPPGGTTRLIPTPDGSLLLLTDDGNLTRVRRVIPPEARILDSATIGHASVAVRTMVGDRLWAVTDSGLIALHGRTLEKVFQMRINDSVLALATTPSGDRVFFATPDNELRLVDRYAERERDEIELPRAAEALRMDPDGRYLLAKARGADSVYVISVGTARVVNAVETEWRQDLPLVMPDGRLLIARGSDVVVVDAESGRDRLRYPGGAADLWALVRWNGFRPRAAGLDRPVEFEQYAADSAAADSALAALLAARYGNVTGIGQATPQPTAPPPPGSFARPAPPEPPRRQTESGTWTVSFATLLNETNARTLADSIAYGGRRARVVLGNRDGISVWRVLLGPYDSRADAERAGMATRRAYWVFEGAP